MSLVLSVDNHIMKNTSLVRKCVELYKKRMYDYDLQTDY